MCSTIDNHCLPWAYLFRSAASSSPSIYWFHHPTHVSLWFSTVVSIRRIIGTSSGKSSSCGPRIMSEVWVTSRIRSVLIKQSTFDTYVWGLLESPTILKYTKSHIYLVTRNTNTSSDINPSSSVIYVYNHYITFHLNHTFFFYRIIV